MTSSELQASPFTDCIQSIASIVLPVLILSGCSRVMHQQPAAPPPPPTGEIFVTSYAENAVIAYRPGASGNVAPDLRIGRVLASPSGVARDRRGKLYVTNAALNTISIFAPGANADTPPIATIRGGNTRLDGPAPIVIGASGKIYVANAEYPGSAGSVNVYQAGAQGNVAPIATIRGKKTGLHWCSGIALDSSDRIYVTNGGGASKLAPSITVYPADANGDLAPISTIAGRRTGLISPTGIALDSRGTIYVADAGRSFPSPGRVEVYPAGSNGNVAPIATISGKATHLYAPAAIALDSRARIYVANYHAEQIGRGAIQPNQDSITVYAAHSRGDVAPIAEISGGDTSLNSPDGLMLDPSGNIYAANTGPWNGYPGTVTAYPPGSSGNVKPLATIRGGADTGISRPMAIALDSGGNIYVANLDSSVTVYTAGTDRNVQPAATIKGANTRLCPNGIAIDSKENIYVVNKFQGALGDRFRPEENLSVTTYPAGSDGNVVPAAVISGPRTGLRSLAGIAVDSAGNVYVANGGGDLLEKAGRWVNQAGSSSVTVYRVGGNGDVAPIATIIGAHTGIDFSESLGLGIGIAVDSRGRIYIANSGGGFLHEGSVTVYPSLANLSEQAGYPDVKPITTISGVDTMLVHPQAIALDPLGRIYVLSEDIEAKPEIGRITVYPALGDRAGHLDAPPIATIEGSNTELDTLADGIAVLGPTEAPSGDYPPVGK
jgi:sugar lactone lactonase YvrE